MTRSGKPPVLLVLTQVYVPDPAAVGQHLHDLARQLVADGMEVHVLASARGYDDPSAVYATREERDGVKIRRFRQAVVFGKRSLLSRLVTQFLLMLRLLGFGLFVRRLGGVLVSTSPPFAPFCALVIAALRRVPIIYWVMDINPDQAVSLGMFSEKSWAVRLFDALNRRILRRANRIVTLDPLMEERLLGKLPEHEREKTRQKFDVIAPWPIGSIHDGPTDTAAAGKAFRQSQGWNDRFVIMYSGNHALSHPLDTVLTAAERLAAERPEMLFAFVGGGRRKKDVEAAIERQREQGVAVNIVSLPYQPLEMLSESLAAANVHLVSIGAESVGIVHPCKIYGVLAVRRPVLLLGPAVNHASPLLTALDAEAEFGWSAVGRQVEHGDVDGMMRAIGELADMSPEERAMLGECGHRLMDQVSRDRLRPRMAAVVKQALRENENHSIKENEHDNDTFSTT